MTSSPAIWLLYTAACYRFPVAEYWPLVALLTLAEHTAHKTGEKE